MRFPPFSFAAAPRRVFRYSSSDAAAFTPFVTASAICHALRIAVVFSFFRCFFFAAVRRHIALHDVIRLPRFRFAFFSAAFFAVCLPRQLSADTRFHIFRHVAPRCAAIAASAFAMPPVTVRRIVFISHRYASDYFDVSSLHTFT